MSSDPQDELGGPGGGSAPVPPPDVLVFGPASRRWSTRARWRLAVVVVALAVLTGGGVGVSRWRAAAEPTFAEREVVDLYHSPGATAAGQLDWDPATVETEHGEQGSESVEIAPRTCRPIMSYDQTDDGGASVIVQLTSVSGHRNDDSAGTVVTLLFRDPQGARERYESILIALGRCRSFLDGDSRLTIEDLSQAGRRHRSDASFRLGIGDQPGTIRIRLVRFGNTLTWTVTEDPPATGGGSGAGLPDRVVLGLQHAYRARP